MDEEERADDQEHVRYITDKVIAKVGLAGFMPVSDDQIRAGLDAALPLVLAAHRADVLLEAYAAAASVTEPVRMLRVLADAAVADAANPDLSGHVITYD